MPVGLFELLPVDRTGLHSTASSQESNVPTFADLGVPGELCARLARRNIAEPFPIQALTLPDALAGRDICGRAPTGSGKTLAFGLPIAARVGRAEPRRPRALVLVPTRELAAQVAGEIQLLLPKGSGAVTAIYGGTSYGPQRRALAKGASVVVACPGRLEDLLDQGDLALDDVDLVVLDEADRMADMGFLPAVRRILDRTGPKRQTLLFSATLDSDVDDLVRRYQRKPVRHEAVAHEASIGDVEHRFMQTRSTAHRVELVAQLVRIRERALVFCRTRRGTERLVKQLKASHVTSAAIHGDRTQGQRERALAAFAAGRVSALVATDVAARGIHVDDVACVIHFDLPADPKDYIHRSGRTGRAGATGTVVALVTAEQRGAVKALQRSLGLPRELHTPDIVVARDTEPAATTMVADRRPAPPRNAGGPRRSAAGHKARRRRLQPAAATSATDRGRGRGGKRPARRRSSA
jgi:superfamily II DNA/RNA helicase